MTLPRRGSRILTHGERRYRWRVSTVEGQLQLVVHDDEDSGQVLLARFERHDRYQRTPEGDWSRVSQGRTITPEVVRRMIDHGLVNGWRPLESGPPIAVRTWASDEVAPLPSRAGAGVAARDLAIEQIGDLRFDLSLDPDWRRILLNAEIGRRYPVPADYGPLRREVRALGLRFAVFNDGEIEDGWVVFGIESVDFPDVAMYTTNSRIVDW